MTSIWVDEEDIKCNGLRIKWCDGSFMSGHVLPIVGIFDGFSESELPEDRFIVLQVKGMNVNAHLDVRMDDQIGYFVLKRTGVKMDEFFEWYENAVIYPNARLVRQAHSRVEIVDEEVDDANATRVWVDSDMGHINRIMEQDVMERNAQRGLRYVKIGAKYTGVSQAQDRNVAFKVQRSASRTVTAKGRETPLKMTLESGLAGLEREGRLNIADRKKRAMIDAHWSNAQLLR